VLRNHPLTVNVTASDADGPAIASLVADLSGLPAGHNALWTPNGTNTGGTLTWTPLPAHIRATPYNVTFTASNGLTGSATTAITVSDSAATVNLVSNPGFETDLSGWTPYSTTPANFTRVAGGHTGGFCARIQGSSTSSFGIDDLPNTVTTVPGVGTRYRMSAWIRSDNSVRAVKIRIYELNGSGSQIGSTYYSPEVTLSPAWKLVTVEHTTQAATATALSVRITNYPSVANEVFFIDDVSIEEITDETVMESGPSAGDPIARLTVTPATGPAPLQVFADAGASAPAGSTIVAYRFDFGDGTVVGPQASPTATHTYAAGLWTARVTVEDESGAQATTSTQITALAGETNLASNPGFESGLEGWGPYGTTMANLTHVAGGRNGGHAVQVRGASRSSFGIDDVPNTIASAGEGSIYRFSAWVRSDVTRRAVKIRVYEFAGGTQVGKTFYSPEVALSPEWQLVTVDYEVQQAGSALSMRLTNYPSVSGETFLVDDVSIVLVAPGAAATVMTRPEISVIGDPTPRSNRSSTERAFGRAGAEVVRLDSDQPYWPVSIEGVDGPEMDGNFPRVALILDGKRIEAVEDETLLGEDADDNGFEEIAAGFQREALATLFEGVPATQRKVRVTVEVRLSSSVKRSFPAELEIQRPTLVFEARFAPNPFRSTGTLSFAVTRRGPVKAEVFDVNGRRVRMLMEHGDLKPGRYQLPVNAQDEASGRMQTGVYFYRIEAREGVLRGRFVLTR
jgi:hypothetical protein